MSEWYYAKQGQQIGPVSAAELKQLAASGAIGPDDLVWNESMSQWAGARNVAGLQFGPRNASVVPQSPGEIPTAAVASPSALAYEAPGAEAAVTPRAVELFRRTRPWTLFLTVMGFIGAGLMAIGGVGILVMAVTQPATPAVVFGAVFYVLSAGLYLLLAILLMRYSSRIADLARMRRAVDLEAAIDAQRSVWKFMGILTIATIVLGLVVVLIGALGAAMRL